MQSRVFLDASFWICLRDSREPWHSQSREIAGRLLKARNQLVFTSFVLAETHAHVSRSPAIRIQVLDDAERNPALHWEPISHADEVAAVRILRQYRDKSFSLCDAISFVVMRRLGVHRVATFDDHFRQFGGFEIVS